MFKVLFFISQAVILELIITQGFYRFALMMETAGSSQIRHIQGQNCIFAVNMDNLLSSAWQEQAAGSFCVGSIQALCSLVSHGHVKS